MHSRRSFLKFLGCGAAAAIAAPAAAIAAPIAAPVVPAIPAPLPEVNLIVDSCEVVAKNRKLKAVWSREAAEDLRLVHNLQAEKELTQMLSQEINKEIDTEILSDLRRLAA